MSQFKFFLTIVTIFIFTLNSNAQDVSIPEGIYRNASEFNVKKPFSDLKGRLRKDTVLLKDISRSASIENFKFVYDDKELRRENDKIIGKKVFGFSDGEFFYLNGCTSCRYYSDTVFYKVLILNERYGLCKRIFSVQNGRAIGNFVVDFELGNDQLLTKGFIKRLIKNNDSLYQNFKKEKNRGRMESLLKYLSIYTQIKQ
jgi:hypothetical protein